MREAGHPLAGRALRSEIAFGGGMIVAAGSTFLAIGYRHGITGAGLAVIMLVIVRSDWRAHIIPNLANLAAAGLALVDALLSEQPQSAVIDALARGAGLFLLFLGFRSACRFWRGREGLGLGDVKLAGVLGLWLDFPYIPVAIEMACLCAIVYVLARKIVSGRPIDSLARLPFGAFLAPAIWVTWLWQRIPS